MIFIILNSVLVFTVFLALRNQAVYSERTRMTDFIFQQKDWSRLLDLKHQVGYNCMVLHFWKWPVHSMWPAELQLLRRKYADR